RWSCGSCRTRPGGAAVPTTPSTPVGPPAPSPPACRGSERRRGLSRRPVSHPAPTDPEGYARGSVAAMERHATALQVAAAVASGEVSPSEVLEHYLAEVDRLDPALNAFALRDDDRARAEARSADDAVVRARRDGTELPPFAGIPIPINDLYDVAGWVPGYGSLGETDDPATFDELVVERLRRAGFVLMGKTTTPEFGSVSATECRRTGITRNPWNTDRT